MPHTRDPLRSFYLAGTVSIPSPFPEVGILSLAKFDSAGTGRAVPGFLRIEHVQSPRLVVARNVLVDDVQALFLPDDPDNPDLSRGTWFSGPGTRKKWLAKMKRPSSRPVHGIVYVHENARVLMQVEVGMTAAESAEYYPPIPQERSDAHYDLGMSATTAPCAVVQSSPCLGQQKKKSHAIFC